MAKPSNIKGVKDKVADRQRSQDVQNQSGEETNWFTGHVRDYVGQRVPMVLSTRSWEYRNKYIKLWVNPNNVSWSLPRRGTVSKTAAGTVRNVWRNRYRGTYYDEGTLNITFQTGSILPAAGLPNDVFGTRGYSSGSFTEADGTVKTISENVRTGFLEDNNRRSLFGLMQNPPPPPGLQNFYDFLELVDQPVLWGRHENFHVIYYKTRVFPAMKILGFFTEEPIAFTETADNANKLEWTATFQVYHTSPLFYKSAKLHSSYSDTLMGSRELFPSGFDYSDFAEQYQEIHSNESVAAATNAISSAAAIIATDSSDPAAAGKDKDPSKALTALAASGNAVANTPVTRAQASRQDFQAVRDKYVKAIGTESEDQIAMSTAYAKSLNDLYTQFENSNTPLTQEQMDSFSKDWVKQNQGAFASGRVGG